jgi:hypothetical protein
MWRFGTVALLTVVVPGCAAPERVRPPEQIPASQQVPTFERVQTPAQVQTPEQVQTLEQDQKREQRQRRIAAEKKRIAAEKERIAEHLQRDLGPVCTSAGLIPGTDAHSRCVDGLYRLELERRAANRPLPK